LDSSLVDRKWDKINPRYKQRLLMVFKIMKEQHGYELVLLEGYRSPSRQNMLAGNPNTTKAKGYQSYHQFGLAADVAFKRNGKVVITERDPWAMRGYELYGQVAESVGLTWGGRWKSIKDYGHTEYRMLGLRKTKEMADQLIAEGQIVANNNVS
jgi:peptidoglycan L-alanyl-D-glutamate endopeptidase CwlK